MTKHAPGELTVSMEVKYLLNCFSPSIPHSIRNPGRISRIPRHDHPFLRADGGLGDVFGVVGGSFEVSGGVDEAENAMRQTQGDSEQRRRRFDLSNKA